MKLLLDTHIFLWLINQDSRLPKQWEQAVQNPINEIFLSVVSIWECEIKYQIGKLNFPNSPAIYLPQQRSKHFIKSLVVDEATITQLINLPLLHRARSIRSLINLSSITT
jgi:PIN domain nuclease of toxin-antitoxin system